MNNTNQTRRDFLKTAGAALLGSAVFGRNCFGRGARGPNVIFILTDEQPERKNHAEKHPEVVERLRLLHNQWARAVAPKEAP
jgi:hypothetical protein